MRVLVTGASGLVGGRLLTALMSDGTTHVRAASRTVRRWPPGVEGAVIRPDAFQDLMIACQGMDVVINLASMPEAACTADPDGALRANAGGTLALMREAVRANTARFVQLSTSKVYGNDLAGAVTEETLTHPVSHYGITHRAAEDYASQHPHAVVLRLANGFGAPVSADARSWGVIVNDFCRQAVTKHQIAIRSDGLAWRNFIPLGDVVIALRAAAVGLPRGTYNLGSEKSMTIRAMAERVSTVCRDMLGVRVGVSVGASVTDGPRIPLDYRTDRLRAAGLALKGSIDDEIKSTLAAARQATKLLPDV